MYKIKPIIDECYSFFKRVAVYDFIVKLGVVVTILSGLISMYTFFQKDTRTEEMGSNSIINDVEISGNSNGVINIGSDLRGSVINIDGAKSSDVKKEDVDEGDN
ncbi:hypothetical protein [Pseudoalteromonas rubra]|uniref:Uncharacterized protein n=1 Tax=Pseudoalteromonas rubra TaxID=43658 RepID=A0A0F4QH94_9GAMM|nr:hypothetical protein [Pseudoalteromonas rubra]KJZ07073.1 hypothetical protein TW77_16435 [Pseudoalteromonas rubra]